MNTDVCHPASALRRRVMAFTLIELLVVITIMGILITIGLPSIRGMAKSNSLAAADRQMLDDLAYARQLALANHTTVYIVFVPTNIVNTTVYRTATSATADPVGYATLQLYRGQFTTYAMMSLRSVGDQPGQNNPQYLTDWRSLPNGVFIPPQKYGPYYLNPGNVKTNAFAYPSGDTTLPPTDLGTIQGAVNTYTFPFPFVTNTATQARLPYIGFDYQGSLVSRMDEYIPLAHGSVLVTLDANGIPQPVSADVEELPPGNTVYEVPDPNYETNAYNQIHIDWLTGRAHVETPAIQ
jgi:prepilin-type N-terminal cleavage/methylation domain-containing protein